MSRIFVDKQKNDPRLLGGLAGLTTTTRYAPPEDATLDGDTVTSAVAVAKDIERTVRRGLDRRARLRALLDPRAP
jgi:hypothetical protein